MTDVDEPSLGELGRAYGRLEKAVEQISRDLQALPDKLAHSYVHVDVYNARRTILEERITSLEDASRAEVEAMRSEVATIRAEIIALKTAMWRAGGLMVTLVAAIVSSGVLFHIYR